MNYFKNVNCNKTRSLDLVSLTRGIKYLVENDNKTYNFFYKSSFQFLLTYYLKLTFPNTPRFQTFWL